MKLFRLTIVAVVIAVVPYLASAETPQPFLGYCYPAGGQRGTTVEATLMGQNLQGATEIHISGKGVTAKILKTDPKAGPPPASSQALAFTASATVAFTIAPDAEPGLRDVRIMTPGGMSNRLRFDVGQLPEVMEKEPNNTRQQAQAVSMPVTINGQIMEGDRDCFRFTAKAGQKLVCRVQARVLIPFIADAVPGWNDAVLTLMDASGHELKTVDDFRFQPDPVLMFDVPRDGEYILEIHDVLMRGRGDFVYRLSIGELPFITHVFPLGGQRGTTTHVNVFGVHLPASTMDVALPADAPAKTQLWLAAGGINSNSVPFFADDLKQVMETEPNDTPATANRVETPVTINGRIDKPGDVDHFVFAAKAGEKLVMDVRARRLESPLDSMLTLFGPKGQKLAENDDTPDPEEGMITHQADSKIIYTIPAAGDYTLRIRDMQGKGGSEYSYRLTIAPQRPDFALRITPDNPRAARSDCAVLTVYAVRKDGFAEPIRLTVDGLPKGCVVSPAEIPAKQDRTSFTVLMPADAPLGVLSPGVTGTAMVGGKEVTRRALPAEELMQAFSYKHILPTGEVAMTVVDGGGMAVALEKPVTAPIEVAPGAQFDLPVKVTRPAGQKGAVAFKLVNAGQGVSIRAGFIPADKDEGVVTLGGSRAAAAGMVVNAIVTASMRSGKDTFDRTLPAIPVKIVAAAPTT
ncbi:MAG: DVUA0089 family protein, partial [Tepidisphaerales bacterium]